jgi:hypothetical protein
MVNCFLGTMLLLSTLSVFGTVEQANEIPKPPAQPSSGPGGSDYAYNQVIKSKYGSFGKQYWIYEPTDPAPESAPLIVFLHGWSAMDPIGYETWIEHIVKRGNIVVYPKYQASPFTQPKDFTPNAIAAVTGAIEELQIGKHVKPELNNFARALCRRNYRSKHGCKLCCRVAGAKGNHVCRTRGDRCSRA